MLHRINKYQIQLSWTMLLLYFIQLFPNILWMLIPVENNILASNEGMTPFIDGLEHTLGIMLVCSMILLKPTVQKEATHKKLYCIIAGGCIISYYFCWIAYYAGNRSGMLFFLMAALPPIYFLMISFWRKHRILSLITISFAIVHIAITYQNLIEEVFR